MFIVVNSVTGVVGETSYWAKLLLNPTNHGLSQAFGEITLGK